MTISPVRHLAKGTWKRLSGGSGSGGEYVRISDPRASAKGGRGEDNRPVDVLGSLGSLGEFDELDAALQSMATLSLDDDPATANWSQLLLADVVG